MKRNTITIMMVSIIIVAATATSLVLADMHSDTTEDRSNEKDDGVVCTREYAPVCGVDGETYSNTCVAEEQEGVEVAYEGECEDDTDENNKPEACYDIYQPVCGVDGETYGNDCYAEREGVEIAYEGECDGNANESYDGENEETFTCSQEEKEADFCTMEYDPVCGDDGNTYGNPCVGCTEGIDSYTIGEC